MTRRIVSVLGSTNEQRIVRLARSFPSLERADGLTPWDVVRFLGWALSPASTSGNWAAAMFVLQVWNPSTDWARLALDEGLIDPPTPNPHLDIRETAAELLGPAAAETFDADWVARADAAVKRSRSFAFNVGWAFSVWDDPHRQAFLRWCESPFFP